MIILRDGYFLDFFSRSEACYPPQIESQTEVHDQEIQFEHLVCNHPAFPFHAALQVRSEKSIGQVIIAVCFNRVVCSSYRANREKIVRGSVDPRRRESGVDLWKLFRFIECLL